MIVMIKSAPDTSDGTAGLALAKEGGADLVLLQNGVYFARKERLGSFAGAVSIRDDDARLRGLRGDEIDGRARMIGYDKLTDIFTGDAKVIGLF